MIRYTLEEGFFGPNPPTLDVPVVSKFFYNARKNYVAKWNVFYEDGWLSYFGDLLNNSLVHDYLCSVMKDSCGFNVDTTGPCQDQLAALPTATNGVYIDGNSQGCRALHGVFAEINTDHCAHIAFPPTKDPNGKIKCQQSEGIDVMDLFTEDDLTKFRQFEVDNGIDPAIGYVKVSV